jgi:aryl-alcohol dehydrogenase-like predicted oxidoreductase
MNRRPIPSSGEELPVIGCGTYVGFDQRPGSSEYARLPEVLQALLGARGTVLDTSPMYGRAETTLGELLSALQPGAAPFLATKVWTQGEGAGRRQMETSMTRLGVGVVDLIQVHNLVDWRVHLKTLRAWRDAGRIRYVGITHYTSSAYAEVEAVLTSEPLDFLQINYSLEEPTAADRLLPLAAQRGVAVLINRPFGGGGLVRRLGHRSLPVWAGEIECTSWAQVLLKFALSHSAVTGVIPGSSKPEHMRANAEAGCGAIPEPGYWRDKVDQVLG